MKQTVIQVISTVTVVHEDDMAPVVASVDANAATGTGDVVETHLETQLVINTHRLE